MGKKTVWIVEENPAFRRRVEEALTATGFKVVSLDHVAAPWPWSSDDALILDSDLLPAPGIPWLTIALIPAGDAVAHVAALKGGACCCIPRDTDWIPFLPTVLNVLRVRQGAPASPGMYERMFEQIEEGIIVEDSSGHIVFASRRAAEMMGWQIEDLLGRYSSELVAPDDQQRAADETVKRSQGIASRYEIRILHRDGSALPLFVTGTPIFEQGRFDGVLVTFRDISHEKSLRERFQALQTVALVIGGAEDLSTILQRTREALQLLIGGAHTVLFAIASGDGELLYPLALDEEQPHARSYAHAMGCPPLGFSLPLSGLPVEWHERIAKGRPCFSLDVAGLLQCTVAPPAARAAAGGQARSVVGLPLRSGGLLRGLIIVVTDQEWVRQEDLDLGMAVASLVAARLENDAVQEQVQRQMYNLERLFDLTRALSHSLESRALADIAARQFIQILDVQRATICLRGPTGDSLTVMTDLFYDQATDTFRPQEGEEALSLLNPPVISRVLDRQQPIQMLVSDTAISSVELDYLRRAGARTLLFLPLIHKGERVGVVELADMLRERSFPADRVSLAMMLAGQVAGALENARLFAEIQRRAVQLKTAADVSRHATSILSVETLLSQTTELIRERFGLHYVGIFLLDDTGRWAVLRAGTGEAGQVMLQAGHRLEIGGPSMIGWCTAHGEARIALDVGQEAVRFDNPLLPATRSEMALPLISRGRVIGAMTIQSSQPAAFSQEDLTVLQTMADQLATAIENAALHEEQARRLTELAALYEVGRAITAVLDPRELLEAVHQQISRFTEAPMFYIAVWDHEANRIRLPVVIEPNQRLYDQELGWSGLVGWVLRNRQSLLIEDFSREETIPPGVEPVIVGEADPCSAVVVPLAVGERIIGALSVQRETGGPYSREDLDFLTAVASQVAVAVENARLYQAVKEHLTQLETAYTKLQELDYVKDELIQNVSHEIRTPLTFLKSYIQMLLDEELGPLTELQRAKLQIVQRKTEQLGCLVGDMITLEVVNRQALDMRPTDLAQLARRALEDCRPAAQEAGLDLCEQLPTDLPPVLCDSFRISQVFDNLLSNAIKFSPDGGTVTVRVDEAGDCLRAEVQDTGIGISSDQVPRLFERFYQVDGSTHRRFGGVGLGLAIVKRIVETHGGVVGVHSAVGQGSTFFFTLPKALGEHCPSAAEGGPSPRP